MFRNEAESRAFFGGPDFVPALVTLFIAGALVWLVLTRTRAGRLILLVVLFVLLAAAARALATVVRLVLVATGVG